MLKARRRGVHDIFFFSLIPQTLTFLGFDEKGLQVGEAHALLPRDPAVRLLNDVTEHLVPPVLRVALVVLRNKVLVPCNMRREIARLKARGSVLLEFSQRNNQTQMQTRRTKENCSTEVYT